MFIELLTKRVLTLFKRGCGGRIDVPSFETLHGMKPFCMSVHSAFDLLFVLIGPFLLVLC
jgi:hypothetical protein